MKPMLATAAAALAFLVSGCEGERDRTMMRGLDGEDVLTSVSPRGGATGVARSPEIVLRFGVPMDAGMERYVDLHAGDLASPPMPMDCRWSGDRTTLSCTPRNPLAPRTTHVIHVGGGLRTQAGGSIDCLRYGPELGGHPIGAGMRDGYGHGGHPWGMMEPGWRHPDGHYGMAFDFTTA
jgi:hypothetical protein